MAILALEGPDRCGKSTVFHLLQQQVNAKFVPGLPIAKEAMPLMHHMEQRQAHVWRHLYDRDKLYICDRHFAVSAPVYDELYGRPQLDVKAWIREVIPVYFDVTEAELRRRHRATGDELFALENYAAVKQLYEKHIRRFQYVRIDGNRPAGELAEQIAMLAKGML